MMDRELLHLPLQPIEIFMKNQPPANELEKKKRKKQQK